MNPSCNCEKCELKGIFIGHLRETDIETFCAQKTEKHFSKGEIIIEQGADISEFTYLKDGLVKLFRKADGEKEQIIAIAKPFDFVSLLSVFSEKKYNYSVTAIEDSIICILDLDFIKNIIGSNGVLALNILEKMSKAGDNIIVNMLNIRQKQLRGRIAYILIYFADKIYANTTFDLPISRKEIAEYIGMTTENVIRILSEFRQDRIIRINGKTIEIADMERLKAISNFG
jgi:CRP/FNR family transcriptional regulator